MGNCVGGKGAKKGDPKKLTDQEVKLLMDNTRLTREQILALHRNFLKECPSGKLTKKDFIKLFKAVHPSENKKEKADKFCEYVFKVIDKNNLGYISFEEFVLCFILTSDGDFRDKCDFAFRLYDLDRDNKISKKEMTQVLTALYDLSGITERKGNDAPAKKVDDIIRKINFDHKISEPSSLKKGAKPSKADKGPDYITRDQFIAACNSDDQIKHLFVDSIFCGGSESTLVFTSPGTSSVTATGPSIKTTAQTSNVSVTPADLRFTTPSAKVDGGNLNFTAPSLSVNNRSAAVNVDHPHIHNHENDIPSLIRVDLPESHHAKVELPKFNARANVSPDFGVHADVGHADLSTDIGHADLRTDIGSAELRTPRADFDFSADAGDADLRLNTDLNRGAGVSIEAPMIRLPSMPKLEFDEPVITKTTTTTTSAQPVGGDFSWEGLGSTVKIETPSVDVNVTAPSVEVTTSEDKKDEEKSDEIKSDEDKDKKVEKKDDEDKKEAVAVAAN